MALLAGSIDGYPRFSFRKIGVSEDGEPYFRIYVHLGKFEFTLAHCASEEMLVNMQELSSGCVWTEE